MLLYSRRVSFNNLYPTYIDPSNPAHVPPQCKDEHQQLDGKSRFFDLNFGFGGASINNIEQHYTKQTLLNQPRRKIPKLPPPPSKSILKKRKHNSEINYTISKNYQDDHSAVFSEEDDDDEDDEDLPTTPPLAVQTKPPRRKSLAGMTDEELTALEESYTVKSTLNIDSFNFKNTPKVFVQSPESKSTTKTNTTATTSATGLIDKPYPSRPVVEHGACCISSKHQDYDKYFSDEATRVLLTCITGRRHTWNAIDYIINELAVDGDYIVITSHIPIRETAAGIVQNNYQEKDQREFESSKSYNVSSSLIYDKCQNILNYVIKLTTVRKLNLKISVEIINCQSSKEVFNDSLSLYKPHVIVVGSKTDEDTLNRTISASSSSSNDFEMKRIPLQRKNSSTVSTLGKGYNGYYRVCGNKCMKLTSYMIQKSAVPVVVVTNNYASAKIKFRSPFDNDDDEIEEADEIIDGDIEYFKKKLTAVSDTSRIKSINDLMQMNNLKRLPSNDSSISSSDELPRTFGVANAISSPNIKVKFGDDLGFGNGHSMYKVKSLLDPVENLSVASSNTRSSYSGSIPDKKKTHRSKSEGNAPDNSSMAKLGLSLKKFGFGKRK